MNIRSYERPHKKGRGADIDSLPCPVVIMDSNWSVVECNDAAAVKFGLGDRSSLNGKNIIETLKPKESGKVESLMDSLRKEGRISDEELTFRTNDGKEIYTQMSASALNDVKGSSGYYITMFYDISERKKFEEYLLGSYRTLVKEVLKRTTQLEEAEKKLADNKRLSDIGTLAATVAHELRNPLGVISSAVYNIKKKKLRPLIVKHVDNIEKKIHESDQIINNLLAFTGIRPPSIEDVRIVPLLEECISEIREKYPKQRLIVIKALKTVQDAVIKADPVQLRVIFRNILDNSFCAVGQRSGKIEVISYMDNGEIIIIIIKDNGIGMDKNVLGRVTEEFFSTKTNGMGLGLSICRQLIELHGGKLSIRSKKGSGTSVSVRLPVK